jgi:NifB/MoaA-like Fe-S oxidoreductase
MGDSQPEIAIRSVKILRKLRIHFHGSLVALPHLVGWNDLRNTLEYLDQAGALTIRVLLPGYTRLSDPSLISPLLFDSLIFKLYNIYRQFEKIFAFVCILLSLTEC